MSGQISISGQITGVPAGTIKPGPFTIPANNTSNASVVSTLLLSGDNTIDIPSWAAGVVIVPPTDNTEILTLKGVPSDTGFLISAQHPAAIPFHNPPSDSFVINAADDLSAQTDIIFF